MPLAFMNTVPAQSGTAIFTNYYSSAHVGKNVIVFEDTLATIVYKHSRHFVFMNAVSPQSGVSALTNCHASAFISKNIFVLEHALPIGINVYTSALFAIMNPITT